MNTETKPQTLPSEIDITSLLTADMSAYARSVATGGPDAAKEAWAAAKQGPRGVLTSPEMREAFKRHIKSLGDWSWKELNAHSNDDLDALLLQYVGLELMDMGLASLNDVDWDEYEELSKAGQISGRLFKGIDDKIYLYVST